MSHANETDAGKPRRPKQKNEALLLAEYQAAQSSAQHHDTLVWTTTSITWGANVVLVGLCFKAAGKLDGVWIPALVCVLGILLTAVPWLFVMPSRSIKRQKYERCKEIERACGMMQNCNLKYCPCQHRIGYALISLGFLGFWVVSLVAIWIRRSL